MDHLDENITIPDALELAARVFGDDEALVDGTVRLSFADLRDRARTCARALIAEGLRPGDRVALWSPNTHHWVEAALGALFAGAVLVPVNTRFTADEACDVLRRSRATTLVVAGPFLGVDRLDQLRSATGGDIPGLRAVTGLRAVIRVPIQDELDDTSGTISWREIPERASGIADSEVDARVTACDPDSPADIFFTSGTTGTSKGAVSSHRQSLSVAEAWAEHAGLSPTDRYLVINPFFHTFGYKVGILASLLRGATLIPQTTFDTESAFRTITTERITVFPGAPTIYQSMLDDPTRSAYDLTSLRLAVTGAAAVPVSLVERMQGELTFEHVLTAYGLSEAVCATMCRRDDDAHTVAHTSGRATAGFEIRIVSNDGTALDSGEPGEVLLRGPNTMLRYLDDPESTAATLDDDGWLHTGDLGVVDDRGYLTLTGRLKDMYICGGFNVYPAEIEQTLSRLRGVADSAVIGIPDARLGEVGKAYVVADTREPPSKEDVLAYCRERLANFKVPRQVEFVSELPRNSMGKVLKRVLRADSGPRFPEPPQGDSCTAHA